MSPAAVADLPAVWWLRWQQWEKAKRLGAARQRVEARGFAKSSPDDLAAYNELILHGRNRN